MTKKELIEKLQAIEGDSLEMGIWLHEQNLRLKLTSITIFDGIAPEPGEKVVVLG